MSGQYPSGFRGQFNPQQQQQHQQMMNQQQSGGSGSGAGMPSTSQQQMMQQQMHQQQHQGHQNAPISHSSSGIPPPHAPISANPMLAIAQQHNTHKEINIVALARLGQETVQDITTRFQEIFTVLKIIQPTANRDNNTEKKVQEYFRTIRLLFKRVRIIYEKCNDGYPAMEYTQVQSLIPYRDVPEHRIDPPQCEEYKKALQENQELIETVKLKNRQLREIIDRTRIIIWEINTMLSMRRS